MNEIITVNERALIDPAGKPSAEPESPLLIAAEETAAWLIDETDHGRYPGARHTWKVFEDHWERAFPKSAGVMSSKDYCEQLQQIPHACCRLRDLIWPREVLQPVRPYKLIVDGVTITGQYAVLRSARRRKHAQIIYLRHSGERRRPLIPDTLSTARWLYIDARWAQVASAWQINSIGVLHYWIANADFAAEHKPDVASAKQMLVHAVSALGQSKLLNGA